MPLGDSPPHADIIIGVEGNDIIFYNAGGKGLSLDTQVKLMIGGEEQDSFTVDEYLHEEFKGDDLWSYPEQFSYNIHLLEGKDVTVNIVDVASNSLITNAKIDARNPLNTIIRTIDPYYQNSEPLTITARSTGATPDNVTLWYRWNWMWEDTFNNDDDLVSSYSNMSFSQGDYVVVTQSGGGDIFEDYVDNNVGDVDFSSDLGTHSNFDNEKSRESSYDTLTEENSLLDLEDYVDSDSSNVDSSSDIGSHINFNNQKAKDGSFDTLTEENTAAGSTTTTLIDDDFEGGLSNWDTDWDFRNDQYTSYDTSIRCDTNDNDLKSVDLDTAGASSITISFRYRVYGIDNDDNVRVQYYTGSGYNDIEEIGDDTENVWLTYSDTINNADADAQYFINNFRLKIEGTSIDDYYGWSEYLWVDDFLVQKVETDYNYSEDIEVDVWDGDSWENVFSDLSSGWNNASVTTWLTSSTFTIRYKGGNETSDIGPDSWQIDAALLHIWSLNYELDLEVSWINVDFQKPTEILCIYAMGW